MEVQDKQEELLMQMLDMADLAAVAQYGEIVEIQQEAVVIQVEVQLLIVTGKRFKVVVEVHIMKESLMMKNRLQFQDVTQVYQRIQAQTETDTR